MNKDYFSRQSTKYAKYRPHYPKELYEYLNKISSGHERAWDCATGNGQAASGLVPYFNEIIATDISEAQIRNAFRHPKIKYYVSHCEDSGIEPQSVDLITVATAIHWLDIDKLYEEVLRVIKPDGVMAVWTYMRSNIGDEVDNLLVYFETETLKDYWAPEIKLAWNFEKAVDFPFRRMEMPEFKMETHWNLNDLKNYLFTWSSVQSYIKLNKSNPIDLIAKALERLWGDEKEKKKIVWDLKMKAGKLLNSEEEKR